MLRFQKLVFCAGLAAACGGPIDPPRGVDPPAEVDSASDPVVGFASHYDPDISVIGGAVEERSRRLRSFTDTYRAARSEEMHAFLAASQGAFEQLATPLATATHPDVISAFRALAMLVDFTRRTSDDVMAGGKGSPCVTFDGASSRGIDRDQGEGRVKLVLSGCPVAEANVVTLRGEAQLTWNSRGASFRMRGARVSSDGLLFRLELSWESPGTAGQAGGDVRAVLEHLPTRGTPDEPGKFSIAIDDLRMPPAGRSRHGTFSFEIPAPGARIRWGVSPERTLDLAVEMRFQDRPGLHSYDRLHLEGSYSDEIGARRIAVPHFHVAFVEGTLFMGNATFAIADRTEHLRSDESDPHGIAFIGFGQQLVVNGRMTMGLRLRGAQRSGSIQAENVTLDLVDTSVPPSGSLGIEWGEELSGHALRIDFTEASESEGWVRVQHREARAERHPLTGVSLRSRQETWYCIQLSFEPALYPIDAEDPASHDCRAP
jgi:hypothetical protein